MKKFLYILLLLLCTFPINANSTEISIKDRRVIDLIDAMESKDPEEKFFYLGYVTGVIDSTMNLGLHLKLWCFPKPMPSPAEFMDQYVRDYLAYNSEVGMDKAKNMQIDQMLFMSWEKRYLCKNQKKSK